MLLGARQFFERRGAPTPPLPYDAEVEYLESTGTQWIDTGRPIPADFLFDATIDITGANNTYKTLLGARIGSGVNDYQFSFQGANNYFLARYGTNISQFFSPIPTGMTRIRVESGGKLYINESFVIQLGVDSPSALNMYIFALNNNGTVSQQAKYIRLYSLKYGGTNEAHDLIPVRFTNELGQSEGAMYDRVSGQLFRNAGTGNFIVGRDTNPISARSYVNDGLVAMWDGEWNAGGGVHDPNATTWKDLIGNRDWALGTSTSYEWTSNSLDAKDQFAATQDFIDGSIVTTVEVCGKIKATTILANFAYIIIGRISASSASPYYGLLYRNPSGQRALMGGYSFFIGTEDEFAGVPATFSFPNYATVSSSGYFNGTSRVPSGNNSLDYNATTRGTVARIGGTAQQPMPIEVYNIRLYSRALTADEIAANYAIDKRRFNLP